MRFEQMLEGLGAPERHNMSHAEAEHWLWDEGMEVLRQTYQDWLDNQGQGIVGPTLAGSDGVLRLQGRTHHRQLESLFGQVEVLRIAYSAEGHDSLHPLDAQLNLPLKKYSHPVSRVVALAAVRSSFDEVMETVGESTAAHVPKRQAEELCQQSAANFDEFYAQRFDQAQESRGSGEASEPIVVLTADGKGVPMLPESLRDATRKTRSKEPSTHQGQRSASSRAGKTREAMVSALYSIEPFVRTAEEVISELQPVHEALERRRPEPQNKRVWASVEKDRKQVVAELFDDAEILDPNHSKDWVALVDGLKHPIELFRAQAKRHGVKLTLILDLLHVLGYLWKAAFALRGRDTPESRSQLTLWLRTILHGQSSRVAAAMRRSATMLGLDAQAREAVDECANYLLNHRHMLRYDLYLAKGYPIATGVIEGACRYLVKDRMERTGARWSLQGAEAVLKLRALWANGDFDEYWAFHLNEEHQDNHASRYSEIALRQGDLQPRTPELRVIK
jgi:hypothetical protein